MYSLHPNKSIFKKRNVALLRKKQVSCCFLPAHNGNMSKSARHFPMLPPCGEPDSTVHPKLLTQARA